MNIEQIFHLSIKTFIFYIFLLIILKIMGKREIGKVSTFDIVVFFVISELFSLSLNTPEASIWHSLIPITIIVMLQLISAFLTLKYKKARNILEGDLTFMIYNGIINYEIMKKERYNIDDLLMQLRCKNIYDINDVAFAILENNGILNIIKKSDSKFIDPRPLISDGHINMKVLNILSVSKVDLIKKLKEKYNYEVKNILVCFLLNDGTFYIISKYPSINTPTIKNDNKSNFNND